LKDHCSDSDAIAGLNLLQSQIEEEERRRVVIIINNKKRRRGEGRLL
jgi:hypothetical protein